MSDEVTAGEHRKASPVSFSTTVIIAGFGPAGRWVAEIFDRRAIGYVIVETNSKTVTTQRELGRNVVEGNVSDENVLRRAGVEKASILVLTVPDEPAVLQAVTVAKRLNPNIYVIARTCYTATGIQAAEVGADAVVNAELVIAHRFADIVEERLSAKHG